MHLPTTHQKQAKQPYTSTRPITSQTLYPILGPVGFLVRGDTMRTKRVLAVVAADEVVEIVDMNASVKAEMDVCVVGARATLIGGQ